MGRLGIHYWWLSLSVAYDSDQETASYYGPINRLALNVGYHNEHHDFPSIAWNRLPRLRALAPEFYDTLRYHTSWTRLLIDFIFDERYTLFSRVERIAQGKVDYDRARRNAAPVAKAA